MTDIQKNLKRKTISFFPLLDIVVITFFSIALISITVFFKNSKVIANAESSGTLSSLVLEKDVERSRPKQLLVVRVMRPVSDDKLRDIGRLVRNSLDCQGLHDVAGIVHADWMEVSVYQTEDK